MGQIAEGALRRHRAVTIAALALLALLAWAWLVSGAGMAMAAEFSLAPFPHRGAPEHAMAMAMGWSLARFLLTFAMWWVMMVAMMLPAAASTVLLYARAAVYRAPPGVLSPPTAFFLSGYLIVWAFFSVGATALQALLEQVGLLSPGAMESASRWLSGSVLIAAGLYQLSPAKNACLSHCRSPADFLSRHYRSGRAGAWRLGLIHGAYCVGCCWVLMALLFVGGVMNIAWIAVLTLIVAAEKHLPWGRTIALIGGLALLVWGAVTLAT